MTDYIQDGHLWISNGTDYLKVFAETILWDRMRDPTIEHHEGGGNYGYDLQKKWFVIKGLGIKLGTNTKYETFIIYIDTWQEAGTLQIEIIRDSSNNKIKLDGTNTKYPVLYRQPGLKGIQKVSPGDQEQFRIDQIIFEQSGAAST